MIWSRHNMCVCILSETEPETPLAQARSCGVAHDRAELGLYAHKGVACLDAHVIDLILGSTTRAGKICSYIGNLVLVIYRVSYLVNCTQKTNRCKRAY